MSKRVSKKDLREFGLLVGILLPFLIGWAIPAILGHSFRLWTLFIALPLLLFSIVAPKKLNYLYKKWILFGNFLANINSNILLGIIFFLIMLPMSIVMRLVRYDPLKMRKSFKLTYKEFRKYNSYNMDDIF